MADISEFASQAASFFGILQESYATQPKLDRLGLPLTRDAVATFIKNVFYASLLPDEGRWPKTTLICYPPETELQFHLLFNEPLPATAKEIAKLSHAISRRSHIACAIQDGEIKLAGVHVNQLTTRRENGFGHGLHMNALKATIHGPGHIVATTDVISLVYCGGEITKLLPLWQSESIQRLVQSVKTEWEEYEGETVNYTVGSVVSELLRGIAKQEHGGMVIVAKNPDMKQFSSSRQTYCLFLNELVTDYSDRMTELKATLGGVDQITEKANQNKCPLQRLNVATAVDQLENCIESIATLCGLDGAIALNYRCSVRAFNAIIDNDKKPQKETKLIYDGGAEVNYDEAFAHKGSRHQAGLLYARLVPDSFVFVVSQDGSLTAFHNPNNGTVICEFGLRPME